MKHKEAVLYVHGKGGSAHESKEYEKLFDCDVIGLDYDDYLPWITRETVLDKYMEMSGKYENIILIANSIGAYFSMLALNDKQLKKAYFISPMVDMEKLILGMMMYADVSEEELRENGEIETDLGETLSWEYLSYVRQNPIRWNAETYILYGAKDNLVSRDTMEKFAKEHKAILTVMDEGEHWFHTPEQMAFLESWIVSNS